MSRLRRALPPLIVAALVVAVFLPTLPFTFLNWDDDAVVVDNANLALPAGLRWAFTTTHLEHYQPLSWLAWTATREAFGLEAAAFHGLNLVLHVVAAVLLFTVARQLLERAVPGMSAAERGAWSAAAALLFALHPMRVEVAAWISAMPYALGLCLALGAAAAWFRASGGGGTGWFLLAVGLFLASGLARPVALGLPVVFVLLDVWLHHRTLRVSLLRSVPFAIVALAVAVAEIVARAPVLADVPWLYRFELATTAPFVYLWRTVFPVGLTPLDVLPREPVGHPGVVLLAALGVTAACALAWWWRRERPGLAVGLVSYLILLAPAAGLTPSGLQATADRYSYVPGVVLALVTAGAAAAWGRGQLLRRQAAGVAIALVLVASTLATRALLPVWHDSLALWTRVVQLDPDNDIGLYNLGTALTAAGRPDEAAARYREALAINPDYGSARANLDRLDAARLEREANDLAAAGNLAQAVERYRTAVSLDPARTHAHAALGMALVTLGRNADARSHLEEARRQGNTEAEVAAALGALLAQTGEMPAARAVLESGLSEHPNDVNLATNLAQVLMSSAPDAGGDAVQALRLARGAEQTTGGRDARVVAVLAAALAANGRMPEARATNARAADLARAQGDEQLAVQITARGRAYRDPGP